ncbi:MAG: hypothetical protein MHM6MM_007086 [Cercozoa sp. M6MM]
MPKRAVERFAFFACAVGAGAYVYRVHVEHLTQVQLKQREFELRQMQLQVQRQKVQLKFEQQQLQLKFEQQQLQLEFELQRYRELPLCRRLLTEPPSASELVEAAKNTRPE